MRRDDVGCIAMLVIIPIVLALIAGIWWVLGYPVVFCVNYLAQKELLPDTHLAYMCVGFLVSLITGGTKVTVKRD
jgi:hypothetical protein